MKKMGLLLIVVLMALLSIGVANAQDTQPGVQGGYSNFVFPVEAKQATPDEIVWKATGAPVNVRGVPTTQGNSPIGSVPSGTMAQFVGFYDNGEDSWDLVRLFSPKASYLAFGWVNTAAAKFGDLPATIAPPPTNGGLVPACNMTDKIAKATTNVRWNDGWAFDTFSTACGLMAEGWNGVDQFMFYWVVRDYVRGSQETSTPGTLDGVKTTDSTLIWNGVFTAPDWDEGGMWKYPRNWNIGDLTSPDDLPMAADMGVKKELVMQAAGYAWPFRLIGLDGNVTEVAYGDWKNYLPDGHQPDSSCDFDEPQAQDVTGILNAKTGLYEAVSLGYPGCTTIVLWQRTTDPTIQISALSTAKESLSYWRLYAAWMFPEGWPLDQDLTWANSQFDSLLPTGSQTEVETIN